MHRISILPFNFYDKASKNTEVMTFTVKMLDFLINTTVNALNLHFQFLLFRTALYFKLKLKMINIHFTVCSKCFLKGIFKNVVNHKN